MGRMERGSWIGSGNWSWKRERSSSSSSSRSGSRDGGDNNRIQERFHCSTCDKHEDSNGSISSSSRNRNSKGSSKRNRGSPEKFLVPPPSPKPSTTRSQTFISRHSSID